MRWVLRAAVLLFPACFHPVYDHPQCGPHGECPSGFTCSAELVCESGSSVNTTGGVCGDGRIDPGEECDDGNRVNGDGCSSRCIKEECGNKILDYGETCDDGNANACGTCSADCTTITSAVATGTIIAVFAQGNIRNGDTLTLNDGFTQNTFEFNPSGGTNIAISFTAGDNAATVASSIITAIAHPWHRQHRGQPRDQQRHGQPDQPPRDLTRQPADR